MKDIGIDLGTANVLVYVKGEGIVLNEPSIVAVDDDSKKVLAVGNEASEMLGKTPLKIKTIKPLKDGVIADFEYTQLMLDKFLKKIKGLRMWMKPRILICCPANITMVEKNAIKEAAEKLGAKKVYVEEEPKIAALGAGMDIAKPTANMVVDIGGGTTDVAILSLGSIVVSESIKLAGNSFDMAIVDFVKEKYKILIGDKTAEAIKKQIGNVTNPNKKNTLEIKGRSLESGLPHVVQISEVDIFEAVNPLVLKMVKSIKNVLESTPPELSADIVDKGLVLTGGGALLKGLNALLENELGINVYVAENPLTSVAEGCGIMLNNLNLLDE